MQDVCEMHGQISRVSSAHQNKEKSSYKHMSANGGF
jgi:hypothetical protein